MYKLKEHIVFKIAVFALVMGLLMPIAVKFVHEIQHEHEHELCENPHEVHVHEFEQDCDFCKFKLNQDYYVERSEVTLVKQEVVKELSILPYSYLFNHQHLSYSLRGPPALV